MTRTAILIALAVVSHIAAASPALAAEVAQLNADNYDQLVPRGKEVDAIYGDYVLWNDRIVAVVGNTVLHRDANLTVHDVNGALIDLTSRHASNDQLSAYYPDSRRYAFTQAKIEQTGGDSAVLMVTGETKPGEPKVEVRYFVNKGADHVVIQTTYTNSGDKPVKITQSDAVRADRTFQDEVSNDPSIVAVYDRWFGQAYGFIPADKHTRAEPIRSGPRFVGVSYAVNGSSEVTIEPGQKWNFVRRVTPGANLFDVMSTARVRGGERLVRASLLVSDAMGPVADADVMVGEGDAATTYGRTDAAGWISFALPTGEHTLQVTHLARGSAEAKVLAVPEPGETGPVRVELPAAGVVAASIRGSDGGPTPCKVQFIGQGDTKDPFLFVDSGEHAVHNCYYSHTGTFTQALPPGEYEAIISYGPEHDAVFRQIKVERGKTTPLHATLRRTVDTRGWVSTEYHSHSSPSGDNTSSQYGRVLNLLCEQIEFAPCTEHQRLSTYAPHLRRLGVEHLLATCVGMELTGSPGDVNHHNAFPLHMHEHEQHGGAPLIDADPRAQIQRLAYWDNKSDKLVQQNHPNIRKVFFDRDNDGKEDGGYGTAEFMDVIEVHPPAAIFSPTRDDEGKIRTNRMLEWMQTFNRGYRIPGVVNTDAHYNFHGSGWLRNYVKSSTDDPAKIDVMEMVHHSEHGHIVMSNGPFMTVRATWTNDRRRRQHDAIPGGDLTAPDGEVTLHVQVQCPNWFDINRVQVLVNGRADEQLNFTRQSHPTLFGGDAAVRFNHRIPVKLAADAHLIVAAAGIGLELGPVMGPARGKDMPVAVSNPVFVDVDGGGFKANGDDLGVPFPQKP